MEHKPLNPPTDNLQLGVGNGVAGGTKGNCLLQCHSASMEAMSLNPLVAAILVVSRFWLLAGRSRLALRTTSEDAETEEGL